MSPAALPESQASADATLAQPNTVGTSLAQLEPLRDEMTDEVLMCGGSRSPVGLPESAPEAEKIQFLKQTFSNMVLKLGQKRQEQIGGDF